MLEEQLVENVKQFTTKTGENFETYYKKYKPKLVRFLIGIGKDEDDAEDVASDAFITSIKKIDTYDPTKAVFSTWLFTIAKRIMFQKTREKSKFTSIDVSEHEEGFSIGETLKYDDTDYETNHAINYQKTTSIRQIIPTLPEKYAIVLTMRHINDKTYQEIADELGYFNISCKNDRDFSKIKTRIEEAKEKFAFKREPVYNVKNNCVTFSLKYDVNKKWIDKDQRRIGGFKLFKNSDDVKTHQQIEEWFKNILFKNVVNDYDFNKHPLNLNTVKSRIRQARLLLYKITKDDFQKLDKLDKEFVDIENIYDIEDCEEFEYQKN